MLASTVVLRMPSFYDFTFLKRTNSESSDSLKDIKRVHESLRADSCDFTFLKRTNSYTIETMEDFDRLGKTLGKDEAIYNKTENNRTM